MKYTQVILLLLLALPCSAQDVITTTSGAEIQGRIFKITPKAVKYHKSTSDSGVLHTIPKKQVHEVRYESGVTETFHEQEKYIDDNDPEGHWDKRSMALQGREDAQTYYDNYQGAKWWTFGATVAVGGILSLIPAIAISSTSPRDENLNYPSETLMENDKYRRAYIKEAKHIKSRKTWGGYGLGIVTNLATGLIFFHL